MRVSRVLGAASIEARAAADDIENSNGSRKTIMIVPARPIVCSQLAAGLFLMDSTDFFADALRFISLLQ